MKRLLCVFCLLLATSAVQAERLKDLASIQGVRSNQLIGYGLVVGLNGTGDQTTQTPFTLQTFNNMLAQFGIKVPAGGGNVQLKNVAAVSVHAELPPFAKPGQTLDVTISSIGNSKSLRGGSLLMTPLKGIDGNVYAIAQGNLVVGGFDAGGADGSRITVNVPSAGRIPAGATVERPVASGFDQGNSLTLNLNRPDFTTAKNIVDQINSLLGPGVAQAIDGGSIRVSAPLDTCSKRRSTQCGLAASTALLSNSGAVTLRLMACTMACGSCSPSAAMGCTWPALFTSHTALASASQSCSVGPASQAVSAAGSARSRAHWLSPARAGRALRARPSTGN